MFITIVKRLHSPLKNYKDNLIYRALDTHSSNGHGPDFIPGDDHLDGKARFDLKSSAMPMGMETKLKKKDSKGKKSLAQSVGRLSVIMKVPHIIKTAVCFSINGEMAFVAITQRALLICGNFVYLSNFHGRGGNTVAYDNCGCHSRPVFLPYG